MQSKSTDQEVPESYFDQAAFNYALSEIGTSHAGSLSVRGRKMGCEGDEDEHSKASFYTSYTAVTDENQQVRKERGRVSFTFELVTF
jgi:hypothetical protein